MSKVFTIGEILVEIMASKIGQPFDQPGIWNGPYPSGAPAIFIDQVTRLGVPCGIISCVGNDGFGDINIHRLAADGVDIRGISVLPLEATGSAFVTYHNSGDRDFIFNIKNAACGKLSAQHVDENILKDCTHFHIMGSSLFSFHMVDAVKKAVTIVKANGGVISFDPNIRKEMLDIPEMRDALHFVLELTDIYMPSEGEVLLLSPHSTPERAIAGFLEEGVKEVIVKRGNQGASYYSANEQFHVESYPVEEVDPTGAGDCFGGAWIACRQLGFDAHRALQYANACGALAVTRRGPMEGTSRLTLERTIRCRYGENVMRIEDKVTNHGFTRQPLQILYHFNYGWPLLSPQAEILLSAKSITPRTPHAAEGLTSHLEICTPQPGFDEQVYYLTLNSDSQGMSKVALVNAELGWGIYEKFDTMQLPNFIQWKNLGAGEYVMGLEVSNSFPDGRDKERAQGRLPFIEPGETKKYCFELGIVDGDAEISALKAEIAGYR